MAEDTKQQDSATSKSEYIIEHVIGCGPFQVIMFFAVFIVGHFSNAFIQMFMAYGNYNPGWRCLDDSNFTTISPQISTKISVASNYSQGLRRDSFSNDEEVPTMHNLHSTDYITDNCTLFDSCQNVEFRPGTTTIVTEWGLLCGKAWVPSLIISLQYAGMVFGATFVGHLGDALGRKTTMYATPVFACVISIASMYVTSWKMFAALRFLLGVASSGFLIFYYVYLVEFVTKKWRGPLPNIPYWPFLCMIFSVVCMLLKNWRQIELTEAIIAGVSFLPVFWLPESPRWLEVNNKTDKFEAAVRKMSKMNGKTLPPFGDIRFETNSTKKDKEIVENCRDMAKSDVKESHDKGDNLEEDEARYSVFDLFKPAYRKYTLLITVPWLSMSVIFYALGFGVKSLSGDFYINLIIMNAFEVPFAPIAMLLPNVIGRKVSGIAFSGISGVCLLTAACFHQFASGYAKTTGVLVLAIAGKIFIGAFWGVIMTYTVEIYPTVVRGLGTSWGNFMTRLGGIAAPFLIPNDSGSFFICYLVMAGLALSCSGVVLLLPETKERELAEKLDE